MVATRNLRRIVLPALLLAVVLSTLVYGYHSDWSIGFSNPKGPGGGYQRPPPPPEGQGQDFPAAPPPGDNKAPPHEHAHGRPDEEWGHEPQDASSSSAAEHPAAAPPSSNFESYLWTSKDLEALHSAKRPALEWTDKQKLKKGSLLSSSDRVRMESADFWRGELGDPRKEGNSLRLPRPHVPQRSEYASDSEYLRQVIPGEFRHGAENIFIMLKTGAETQWARMPIHFMTTLTRTNNFAIYSDTPGSMFGHEVINILKDLPPVVMDKPEFKRYKAHMQMHDEHWNWPPHKLKATGGWDVDKYKNIPMLADAYAKNPNCDWYVWMDDDSYVFYDNLAKWLDTMDPKEMIYTGATAGLQTDIGFLHFAHGGSVIVASRAIAEALFGPKAKNGGIKNFLAYWAAETMKYCCGDAMLGIMIKKELDVDLYMNPRLGDESRRWFGEPFQGEKLSSLITVSNQMCNPIVSWHHVSMHDIELLWEYERMWDAERFITYDDIYRDFVLPYVIDRRPNWVLNGEHIKKHTDREEKFWVEARDEEISPAGSEDNCRDVCIDNPTCTGWSYRGDPAECRLSLTGIVLGEAANQWNKQEGWVTGHLVDRIRAYRSDAPCDPLERDEAGNFNDDLDSSEGWFIRKMKRANRYTAFKDGATIPED